MILLNQGRFLGNAFVEKKRHISVSKLLNEYTKLYISSSYGHLRYHTVKPRPEAHMDMTLFKSVFEEHRLDSTTTYITTALFFIIDNVIVLSDLVESSGYSSKTLQKGSCPYAPLNEALRYITICIFSAKFVVVMSARSIFVINILFFNKIMI